MKLALILYAVILFSDNIYSQCNYTNTTFKSGEDISYNIYYNLGFMWFNAAQVNFRVSGIEYDNKPAFYFTSNGQTLLNYDWIFKVRDSYESIADSATLNPFYFSKNTNEGKYSAHNSYVFSHADSLIFSTINNNSIAQFNDTIKMQQCTFDVLTAVYAFRSISYSTISCGDTIPINMVIDNEIYNLHLNYIGVEDAETDNEVVYRCRKFRILMVEGTIFSGNEDIVLWVSDDDAKIPIKVEADILVGSIIAIIDSVSGNQWPLKSIISQ